jgi:hypothetical protein
MVRRRRRRIVIWICRIEGASEMYLEQNGCGEMG